MVAESKWNGQIKKCRVHDFLREFCKNEAMKINLFQDAKGSVHVNEVMPVDNYLRISINSEILDYVHSKPSGMRLRSFLSFSMEEILLPAQHVQTIPKAFKLLRVFDARALNFTSFPAELYYLILLKYIAMSCDIDTISTKLSKLWKMQTNLDVQTLSTIAPESCTKEVFERCKHLKKLGIRGRNLAEFVNPSNGSGLFDNLSILESLENLKLINDGTVSLPRLPDHNKFPLNLNRLSLCRTSINWEHMSTLGELKNLMVLKLKDNAFVGGIWTVREGGFGSLSVLHIEKTDLLEWEASSAHFPALTTLVLKHCNRLKGIPRDFVNIASLWRIDLHSTTPKVVMSAKKIKLLKLQTQKKFKLSVYPPQF